MPSGRCGLLSCGRPLRPHASKRQSPGMSFCDAERSVRFPCPLCMGGTADPDCDNGVPQSSADSLEWVTAGSY
jgi:hypothetical protein